MSLLQSLMPVLIAAGIALFLTMMAARRVHANNKRIRRGEPPKYHDAIDRPIVNVIDWTRK